MMPPYRGEGIASYTHQIVMALVKKRKKVSHTERFAILEENGNKCQICGDRGDEFSNYLELDHPAPLRDYGDNEQKLVPLCCNCHSHKS